MAADVHQDKMNPKIAQNIGGVFKTLCCRFVLIGESRISNKGILIITQYLVIHLSIYLSIYLSLSLSMYVYIWGSIARRIINQPGF